MNSIINAFWFDVDSFKCSHLVLWLSTCFVHRLYTKDGHVTHNALRDIVLLSPILPSQILKARNDMDEKVER